MAVKSAVLRFLLILLCASAFASTSPVPCEWVNGTGKLEPFIYGESKNKTGITEEDCRDHCTNQTSFICAAVNYRQSDSVCELLTESDQTGTVDTTLTGWEYFIRPLCAGIWFPWEAGKDRAVSNSTEIYTERNIATLRQCMSECLQTMGDNCISVAVSNSSLQNRCRLYGVHALSEKGETSTSDDDWRFFTRPLQYSETSHGVSNGTIVMRTTVGTALFVQGNVTIPISGYIIGWQYYLIQGTKQCSGSSYVSVWGRRGSEGIYRQIAATLLQPEDLSGGVRFQIVPNELIRVEKGDILAIYTKRCGNSDGKNLVSTRGSPGGAAGFRNGFWRQHHTEYLNSSFDARSISISLHAYVTGYTRLPSHPSTSHTSLKHGQIRLVIPAVTNTDSLGAVYYRIMCSTDSSFSQSYNCHDELVKAGTPEVILDGLNITTPLYASVGVVRDFKGEEHVEDVKNTTTTFCPERRELAVDQITINITDHDDYTTGIILLTNTSWAEDDCISGVSIMYGAERFNFSEKIQDRIQFTVSTSSLYTFSMNVTLKDGHEMKYWEGSLDLRPPTTTTTKATGDRGKEPLSSDPTTIAVSVVVVLLLLVAGGVVAVVLLRRRNSRRTNKPASEDFTYAADENKISVDGTSNSGFHRESESDVTKDKNSEELQQNSSIKQRLSRRNDQRESVEVKPSQAQNSQLNMTGKRQSTSKPTAVLAPMPAKAATPAEPTVVPRILVVQRSTDTLSHQITSGSSQHMEGEEEEVPYGNITNRPQSSVSITDLHKHIQQEKTEHPGEAFQNEFRELSVFELAREVGGSSDNRPKNRFRNIIPFDVNRVKLPAKEEGYKSDYINASYIKNFEGVKKYVACQGPREDTIEDMWRLIHHTKCEIVVMTTMIVEEGKRKCEPYWPDSVGETKAYGKFSITLREESVYPLYTIRVLLYTYANASRTVTQYHYTEWYDKNVPTAAGLLSFRSRVKQAQITTKAPIIVHCRQIDVNFWNVPSAGVGRTGTYIALDILIEESKKSQSQNYVDIFSCVNLLRGQRTAMVQTHAQYGFLYEVLSEALTCGSTAIECAKFGSHFSSLKQVSSDSGVSKLYEQHEKLMRTSELTKPEVHGQGLLEENKDKNRDLQILPVMNHNIRIWQPLQDRTDYINAVYCHSYQHRDGFIATQSPLPDTVQDFWTMVVEQTSSAILYYNDCQSEKPFWPLTEGERMAAGEVTVTNRQTRSEKIQEESGNTTITTYQLDCVRNKSGTHKASFIEMKIGDEELPSPQQLVTLCQAIEKFTNTRNKPVTVVCKNGCRLTGFFIVAINLFLKTRFEQQVDVVLEVKLANDSRPQFVNNPVQFERLHEFVDYYLQEFSTYANY